jgi:hypothetical protein
VEGKTVNIEIFEYISDYTLERRFAVKVDGRFPPELDFHTRELAEQAVTEIHLRTAQRGGSNNGRDKTTR